MTARQSVLIVCLSATCSLAVAYVGVQTADVVVADTPLYLAMYRGEPTDHWALRPIVPYAARLVPDVPASALSPRRTDTVQFQTALKFGVVNAVCLTGAGVALFALLQGFGLGLAGGLIGLLCFMTSVPVVRFGGAALVESGFFFAFAGALVAIQRERAGPLLLVTLVGVFVKELVLLAAIAVWLMPSSRRARLRLTAAMLPGAACYLAAMIAWRPATAGYAASLVTGLYWRDFLQDGHGPNVLLSLALAFGIHWVLAGYALARCQVPALLRRWVWLVPVVLAGVVIGGGAFMRNTFTLFPVIIPLSALALRDLIGTAADHERE